MNHYQVVGLKNVDFENLRRKIELSKNSMELIQEIWTSDLKGGQGRSTKRCSEYSKINRNR